MPVSAHYCKDEVKSVVVFGQVKSCMQLQKRQKPCSFPIQLKKTSCCKVKIVGNYCVHEATSEINGLVLTEAKTFAIVMNTLQKKVLCNH